MKKSIYILFSLILTAVFTTSCLNDLLDVPSQSAFDEEVVFSNYELAEFNILGLGEIFGHTNSYRGRAHLHYGFNNDIEWYNTSTNDTANGLTSANQMLAEYRQKADNGTLNTADNPYNEIYVGIERANLCVRGLRTYGNPDGNRDMGHLLGEALTMRAFFYYELIKMWGDVPYRFEPITNETLYVPKINRDVVYKQILADLDEAADLLYWPGEVPATQSTDRVSKAFAKGLYARIALAASGYAWRTADGAEGTGDAGSMRLTTDPELSKAVLYPKALAHLEDVIGSGTRSLEGSFEQLWRKFNEFTHLTASPEVIYVIPFSNGRGRWIWSHGVEHRAGSPYTGPANVGNTRGGATGPVPTLWWKYAKEDTRRDLTCVNWYYNVDATEGINGFAVRAGVNIWYWGKYRFEWMLNYPSANDCGAKPIVMRYADILLMAAEIAAHQGEIGKATGWIKEVRDRAFAGATDPINVGALSAGNASADDYAIQDYDANGTIMKAIIDERALEFAGEMLRKADLIRWGILKEKLDEASADVEALAGMQGAYATYGNYTETIDNNLPENYDEETGEPVNDHVFKQYSIYSRPVAPVEANYYTHKVIVWGLDATEIGQTPPGWVSDAETGGWKKSSYISTEKFWHTRGNDFKWNYFYYNPDDGNDPNPRSVWPIFGQTLANSQGTLVNDFGY